MKTYVYVQDLFRLYFYKNAKTFETEANFGAQTYIGILNVYIYIYTCNKCNRCKRIGFSHALVFVDKFHKSLFVFSKHILFGVQSFRS